MSLSSAILHQRLTRPFRYFDALDSTSDHAKSWLKAGAPPGAAVIANQQQRGRGRESRLWHTPPDAALALSVILHPPPHLLCRINMLGALSVCDLAAGLGCDAVGIKWPNDVQIDGRKVAGILPEALWAGERLLGVVLGIGVNVRIDFSATALADTAVSLEKVLGRRLERAQLLETLLAKIDGWHQQLAGDALFASWKSRLNMLGSRVKVGALEGIALDVLPDGSLLVQDAARAVKIVEAGEVLVQNDRQSGAGAAP